MRVVWVDYKQSALLYMCYHHETSGRCADDASSMTVLSRYHDIQQHTYQDMLQTVDQLCIPSASVIEYASNKLILGEW